MGICKSRVLEAVENIVEKLPPKLEFRGQWRQVFPPFSVPYVLSDEWELALRFRGTSFSFSFSFSFFLFGGKISVFNYGSYSESILFFLLL